ncbi:unnamed protein product, partial [Clonostachys chloroleuca]
VKGLWSSAATKISSYIINPNSSEAITGAIVATIDRMQLGDVRSHLEPDVKGTDKLTATVVHGVQCLHNSAAIFVNYNDVIILIASFGVKSLVSKLSSLGSQTIMGVSEASILTAQTLLSPNSNEKWGIITLGHFWTATKFLGERMGETQYVIDAIKAGILQIQQIIHCRDTFR